MNIRLDRDLETRLRREAGRRQMERPGDRVTAADVIRAALDLALPPLVAPTRPATTPTKEGSRGKP